MKSLEDEAMLRSVTSQLQDAVEVLASGSDELDNAVTAAGVEITAADLAKGVQQLVEDGVKNDALEDSLKLVRDARAVCLELAKAEYVRSVLNAVASNGDADDEDDDAAAKAAAASTTSDSDHDSGNANLGLAVASGSKEFKCLQSVVALQPDLDLGNDRERAEQRKRKAKEMVAAGKEVPAEVPTRRRYRLVSATRISIPGGTGSKGHWMLKHDLGHAKKEQVKLLFSSSTERCVTEMHSLLAGEAPGAGEAKKKSKKSKKKKKKKNKKKINKAETLDCDALSQALVRCAMADGDHLSLGYHPAICEEGHFRARHRGCVWCPVVSPGPRS